MLMKAQVAFSNSRNHPEDFLSANGKKNNIQSEFSSKQTDLFGLSSNTQQVTADMRILS